MNGQVWRVSAGEDQADERAGVAGLSWRVSGRRAGRCRAAQLASIRQMSRQVSRRSGGEYQANEQAGVARLWCRVSGRVAGRCREAQLASIRQMSRKQKTAYEMVVCNWSSDVALPISGRCRGAQLASIRQMSGQVSRSSAGEYQADEQAGVARLWWRVSGR